MPGGAWWKGAACSHWPGCSGHERAVWSQSHTFAMPKGPLYICWLPVGGPLAEAVLAAPAALWSRSMYKGCPYVWPPLLQELEEAEDRFRDHVSHSAQQKGAPTAGFAGRWESRYWQAPCRVPCPKCC